MTIEIKPKRAVGRPRKRVATRQVSLIMSPRQKNVLEMRMLSEGCFNRNAYILKQLNL